MSVSSSIDLTAIVVPTADTVMHLEVVFWKIMIDI